MATPRAVRPLTRLPNRTCSRRRTDDRGAALVEFALILPLVMSLVLGLVTGGVAYNRKLAMNNAVREGSRFGATLPAATPGWATNVIDRTKELASGELSSTTNAQVCVALVKKTGATTESEVQTGSSNSGGCTIPLAQKPATPSFLLPGQCVVKVWSQRTGDKLQAMFFTVPLTLKASSVARFEETTC